MLAVSASAQTASTVSSVGYLNGTAVPSHTTTGFNSVGASTLVAFVSTHPTWPQPGGQAVSISSFTDNLGNTWTKLAGPTTWVGSVFTMVSAIYYVNAPITSTNHTLSVVLTNPAPLAMHAFAVSNSLVTAAPTATAFANPGTDGTSATVTTAAISVAVNSALMAWTKNETVATATAGAGFTLDPNSQSYLWGESRTVTTAGSDSGQFTYSAPIGWQAAAVAVKPSNGPLSFGQAVTTPYDTPANITLAATSRKGLGLTYSVVAGPTNGRLTGDYPNLVYMPNGGYIGSDKFTFQATDGTTSNVATVNIMVQGPYPTTTSVGFTGIGTTSYTTNSFNTVGATSLVAFVSSHPVWPQPGTGLPVAIGSFTDNMGNTWNLLAGPTNWTGNSYITMSAIYYVNAPLTGPNHTLTVTLTNPAPAVIHAFAVSGTNVTSPPISSAINNPGTKGDSINATTPAIAVPADAQLLAWVKNELAATATAVGGYTLDWQSQPYLWAESQTPLVAGSYTGQFQYNAPNGWQAAIVGLKPAAADPPMPAITLTPLNPTNNTSASFSFTDSQTGVGFLCQLDGAAFNPCSTPIAYSGLSQGTHTFAVKAKDSAGNLSVANYFGWSIDTTPPPAPGFTSTPANPTNLNSASFGFTDNEVGAAYLCQLDGGVFSACPNPVTYAGPLANGSHTFAVEAVDLAGNASAPTTFTWSIVAITYVQGNYATPQSSQATVSVPFTSAQAAGDLNVIVVGWNDSTATVKTVADSIGNVYALAVGPTVVTGSLSQSIYYAKNIATAVANTVTVTFSVAAAAPDIRILEYHGVDPTNPVDVTAVGSGNTATSSSASATTTTPSDLIFGANMVLSVTTGAGSGFTARLLTSPDGDIAEDHIVAAIGSYSATAPLLPADSWIMQMVAFRIPPAGPTPSVSSVSPTSGVYTGATAVTITGTNFAAGDTVTFGAAAATNVVVVSGTTITATSPAGSGVVAVTVTSPGGQSGSLAGGFTYISPPTVSSVSPNLGPASGGTAVTITGTNFTAGATVTFGGVAATNVLVVSGTSITATTPPGAAGAVTVTVTTSLGPGNLAGGFTYLGAPTVGSVSPNSGTAAGGTPVTITGTNFAAGATVTFGGTAATSVVVVSGTSITAITPPGTAGAVTVTVTVNGQNGNLTNGFTYLVIPTVTSVAPNTGPTVGGTAVTITGTNFASGATVTFGGTAATNVVVVGSTSITAKTPAGTAGAVTVTVSNPGGQSGSLTSGFTYVLGVPTVTSVTPNTGSTAGGTAVTIAGTNFIAGATVTFGGTAATNVVVVNSTSITATTPVGTAGAVTVTVTVSGQSGNLTNGFTYVLIPTVTSVAPNAGPITGGTAVTITGTNFAAGATVTIGGNAAINVVVVGSTSITATTPGGTAGTATVTVTNPGGQSGSLTNGFGYIGVPTVTSVSPAAGAPAGGTAVTIAGTLFATGATVTFGGNPATNVVVVSGTSITATTPAGTAGAVTVTVTNPGAQSGSLANGFTYAGTITYVQGNYATPQTPQSTVPVIFTGAQAAGDMNVVAVGWNDSTATVTGLVDSSGNVYTLAAAPIVVSGFATQAIYYAPNIVAAAAGANTVTVTFSTPAVYADVRVLEYQGAALTNTVDVTAGSSGSTATSSSGPVTTTNAADLIFGANLVAGITGGPGAGFTSRLLTDPDADIAEDQMVTAIGSYTATAPVNTGLWIMQVVAFKAR